MRENNNGYLLIQHEPSLVGCSCHLVLPHGLSNAREGMPVGETSGGVARDVSYLIRRYLPSCYLRLHREFKGGDNASLFTFTLDCLHLRLRPMAYMYVGYPTPTLTLNA